MGCLPSTNPWDHRRSPWALWSRPLSHGRPHRRPSFLPGWNQIFQAAVHWMVFVRETQETPIKMDDLGVPPFMETLNSVIHWIGERENWKRNQRTPHVIHGGNHGKSTVSDICSLKTTHEVMLPDWWFFDWWKPPTNVYAAGSIGATIRYYYGTIHLLFFQGLILWPQGKRSLGSMWIWVSVRSICIDALFTVKIYFKK